LDNPLGGDRLKVSTAFISDCRRNDNVLVVEHNYGGQGTHNVLNKADGLVQSEHTGKKCAAETYFNLLCGMTISTTVQQENMLFRQNVCSFTPVNGFEEIQ